RSSNAVAIVSNVGRTVVTSTPWVASPSPAPAAAAFPAAPAPSPTAGAADPAAATGTPPAPAAPPPAAAAAAAAPAFGAPGCPPSPPACAPPAAPAAAVPSAGAGCCPAPAAAPASGAPPGAAVICFSSGARKSSICANADAGSEGTTRPSVVWSLTRLLLHCLDSSQELAVGEREPDGVEVAGEPGLREEERAGVGDDCSLDVGLGVLGTPVRLVLVEREMPRDEHVLVDVVVLRGVVRPDVV